MLWHCSISTKRSWVFIPCGGKWSLTWTMAMATTCSSVLCSQRSPLPGTERTFSQWEPDNREEPETHKTNLQSAFDYFFSVTGGKEQHKAPKLSQHRMKTIQKFSKIIYQWKRDRTCKMNIHPTSSYYHHFLHLLFSVLCEKRQVFLEKCSKWAQISELISALLL